MKTLRNSLLVTGMVLASYTPVRADLVYAVTSDQDLISFDSATPGTILTAHGLTGLVGGEVVRAMDFSDANGSLYILGSSSRLYTVNPATGVALPVGSGPFSPILNGTTFGMTWNPAINNFVVVSDLNDSLRIIPTVGVAASYPNVRYAAGDINAGTDPVINGLASFSGSIYALDSSLNILAQLDPSTGDLTSIGLLGTDVSRFNGFDVSPGNGFAYLGSPAASGGLASDFWRLNTGNGQLTLIGHIGGAADSYLVQSLAVVPEPSTAMMMGLGGFALLAYLWRRRA
jgi:hypothetical protein